MIPSKTVRRTATAAMVFLTGGVCVLLAHDMFLKPADFFVQPNSTLLVRLLNGNFSNSENSITRDRLADISMVSPQGRERIDTSRWTVAGDTSTVTIRTGLEGTYLLGVSTRPNIIALEAKDFNEYLETDGMPDVLEARRRDNELDRAVRERYAKHVKTLVQVGDARTAAFATELGYPAEIVPVENPYLLRPGSRMHVRVLFQGRPIANQFIQYGGRTPTGDRIAMRSVRSNAEGVATIPLEAGAWYIKFIHQARRDADPDADYESTWASLSFAIR